MIKKKEKKKQMSNFFVNDIVRPIRSYVLPFDLEFWSFIVPNKE